jgi:hypothetical protein
MRYFVVCVLVGLLAWPQKVAAQVGEEAPTIAGVAIHAQHHLPPQLMLRASYFLYLDADADTDATSDPTGASAEEPVSEPAPEEPALKLEADSAGLEVTPTEQTSQPRKGLSRGGRIALGVIVPVAVFGIVFGAAAAVAVRNSFEDF